MRHLRLVLLAAAGLLIAAPAASATVTSGVAGGVQVFLHSDGAADTMTLRCEGGQATFGALAIAPCAAVERIDIVGAGGNDVVDLSAVTRADFPKLQTVDIDGGAGTDVITGSQVGDHIMSDAQDVVRAGDGDDVVDGGEDVDGGAGDDLLRSSQGRALGGPGNDRFETPAGLGPYAGGPGEDTWVLELPPSAALNLSLSATDSGADVILGINVPVHVIWSSIDRLEAHLSNGALQKVDAHRFTGSLTIDGRGGRDVLIGGPGEDFLTGGDGDDEIDGGGGFDYIRAGAGNDRIRVRDGAVDRARCGPGTDTVTADAGDLLADCETVDRPPVIGTGPPILVTPPPVVIVGPPLYPAPDRKAPKLSLRKARLKGKTLRFSAGCPSGEQRCRAKATLRITGKRGHKRKSVKLARASFRVTGGKHKTVKKKLSAKQRRALRRLHGRLHLSLKLTVTDAAGNHRKQTKTLRLKRSH